MKAIFFGTPEWALPSLDALADSSWKVAAVVTNPDTRAGRGYKVTAPPVKTRAEELGLEVWQPSSARDGELRDRLAEVAPDVAVVVAYGKILPAEVLEVPRLGFVNLHFSLLPAYRGAAPVQHALLDGLAETGVSIMVLTEGMDEGPVLARAATSVEADESAGTVGSRLAEMGAGLLVETLDAYARSELDPEPQDEAKASYAPKLSAEDCRIDWSWPAERVHNLVRALDPAPGAWSFLRGERVKIWRTSAVGDVADLDPGATEHRGGRWLVGTGTGVLAIEEAQLAGKKRLSGDAIVRGLRLEAPHGFE